MATEQLIQCARCAIDAVTCVLCGANVCRRSVCTGGYVRVRRGSGSVFFCETCFANNLESFFCNGNGQEDAFAVGLAEKWMTQGFGHPILRSIQKCIDFDSDRKWMIRALYGHDATRLMVEGDNSFRYPRHPSEIQGDVYIARIMYYTGLETDHSLVTLRVATAALHLLATAPATKEHTPWYTFVATLFLLPLELQLQVCCVQTLSPALPILSDFQ